MNNEELPSESDSSDEDFVPDGAEKEMSEESDGNCVDSGGEDGPEKRKKPVDGVGNSREGLVDVFRKKLKPLKEKENEEKKSEPVAIPSLEEKKKRSDAIWADFLKDCGPPAKKKASSEGDTNGKKEDLKTQASTTQPLPSPTPPVKTVTQLFEFAGEKVEVETEVPDYEGAAAKPNPLGRKTTPSAPGKSCGGGIAGILGQLGKKGKLSTLEKSKLDWEKFKKEQNISEELQRFNKGKMGYLERQEFLERADLRQFELEKDLRTKKRSLNR